MAPKNHQSDSDTTLSSETAQQVKPNWGVSHGLTGLLALSSLQPPRNQATWTTASKRLVSRSLISNSNTYRDQRTVTPGYHEELLHLFPKDFRHSLWIRSFGTASTLGKFASMYFCHFKRA
ncbi:hypothetical protein EG68_03723 [Paragonimus skrjabini miyazakii]|uniref:Uncharacterized protein n=1 Tax=Paragonimus skrjabini miyazakii TaxID=59628 RepID=A0A8S9Z5R3_9TREM|nr:hypothetical protein EG68_03723 [Paragonimus skrjabini miyazakii]